MKMASSAGSPPRDRRMSKEWDASKVPPSRFQKREGSIYSTPSSRDGHTRSRDEAYFSKLKEKVRAILWRLFSESFADRSTGLDQIGPIAQGGPAIGNNYKPLIPLLLACLSTKRNGCDMRYEMLYFLSRLPCPLLLVS